MAAGEAPEGQPGAAEEAETDEGYVGVLRAGGQVETMRGTEGVEDGGENRLVDKVGEADGEGGLRFGHCLVDADGEDLPSCFSATFWMARKTFPTSRSRAANSRSITLRRGWRMTSTGVLSEERFLRTASRMRRLMRLRSTALPITLP